MVESTSTVSGPSPDPAPAAQALVRTSPVTLSSWRTWPKVKPRSQVPTVEAAITRCPSTLAADPQRSSSTSSMQSPPATSAHQRQQLAPRVGRARPVAEIDQLVGQRCGQQQPGRGDRALVVEGDIDLVQHHVRGSHRKGVLRLGDHDRLAAVILPGQRTLFVLLPLHALYLVGGSRLRTELPPGTGPVEHPLAAASWRRYPNSRRQADYR
jgi:hypothetical protein